MRIFAKPARRFRSGGEFLDRLRFPGLSGNWRPPVGLSLALSLAVLLVLVASVQGGQALAGPPDVGALASGSPEAIIPREADALMVGATDTITIMRGEGPCSLCSQSDPFFDPEEGWFTLSRSGAVVDTMYTFGRFGVISDSHALGTFPEPNFFFWLHRDKGCGDFLMSASNLSSTSMMSAPFSVPCTAGLGPDTFLFDESPLPGTIGAPNPICNPSCSRVFYNSGPGRVRVNLNNRTATGMLGQVTLGFAPIVVGGPGQELESPVLFVPGGGSAALDLSLFDTVPQGMQQAQDLGPAAASPVQVTATLVFSFGPTASISQTLIFARPESVFLPLAARGWNGGW